jgi:hypothetical protein
MIFVHSFNYGNEIRVKNFHRQIVVFSYSLTKDYKQRPKYVQLMLQPFFIRAREQSVDVAEWYRQVTKDKQHQ